MINRRVPYLKPCIFLVLFSLFCVHIHSLIYALNPSLPSPSTQTHLSESPSPLFTKKFRSGYWRQLFLVITPDWSSSTGSGTYFEWRAPHSWRAVTSPFAVSIGERGLAWGRGVYPSSKDLSVISSKTALLRQETTLLRQETALMKQETALMKRETALMKREGDGRSPAGAFEIIGAFGRGQHTYKLPYEVIKSGRFCVDDVDSPFYNQFRSLTPSTDSKQESPSPAWRSAEDLFMIDVYDLVLRVAHNHDEPIIKQGGSCIFIHRWTEPHSPTDGCTSMTAQDLSRLAQWLDPRLHPLMIQLPHAEFMLWRERLRLPHLK